MRKILFISLFIACFAPSLIAEVAAHKHHRAHTPGGSSATPPDGAPPEGFEKVDREVVVATVQGLMKFDPELIELPPGSKVKLTLQNTDEMQHNLLICKPGEGVELEVAKAAWAMGPEALDKHFVPDSPLVLFHTLLTNPHQSDTIYFVTPKEEADYPYVCTLPGHAFTMKGTLRIGKGSGKPLPAPSAEKEQAEKYHLFVTDEARAVRCVMADSSPRSIAVGLPGGINFCFDAETCFVRYGWFGPFLDAGPDRGRGGTRGGGANQPLGKRFDLGNIGFPVNPNPDNSPAKPRFGGFRKKPNSIQFLYTLDGIGITQTVSAAERGVGLTYAFELTPPPQSPVRFTVNPERVSIASSAGTWDGGTLTLTAEQAKNFTVTITEKEPRP